MIVDSQKMKSARDRKALTQEDLANKARVNVRTIQRAESGAPIRHETLADIAAVLGMPVSGLLGRGNREELREPKTPWEAEMQVLKRVESGEAVVSGLERAVMSVLGCSAEPNADNMPVLRSAIKLIESLMPSPWDEEFCAPLGFGSLLDRLEAVANLNGCLVELEGAGLALYLAVSTELVHVPRRSEEGLYVRSGQRPEYVSAVRLHISDYGSDRVRLDPVEKWPLETLGDDKVPF